MHIRIILMVLILQAWAPALSQSGETSAAAVLFEKFETIFHTTPMLLSDPIGDTATAFMREPFGYLLVGLDKAGEGTRRAVLADSMSVLLGMKDYLPPHGLGRTISTRCYVVVLREGASVELSKYLNKSFIVSATGPPIWKWKADLGEFGEQDPRPSSLYATQIAQKYILISNNLDEIKNVSERVVSYTNEAAPLGIREWEDIKQHAFWGYRKYRNGQPSVASKIFAGTKGIAADAEALILYVDRKHESGVLRLLVSGVQSATAKNLNELMLKPPLKPVGPREWETTLPLEDQGRLSEISLQVLWLFGLGVAV